MPSDVDVAIRQRRGDAIFKARQAADTIEGVRVDELVPEGCVESALCALEEARDALLAIEVMVAHGQVV